MAAILLTGALALQPASVLAQDPGGEAPPDAPRYAPDTASVERIRAALAATPALRIAELPRFYARASVEPPTLADLMTTWDLSITPITPPSHRPPAFANAIVLDPFQIVHWARRVRRNREVVRIRGRIAAELRALNGAR